MRSALYDMRVRLSTYDFFTWLISVQCLGFDHVSFFVSGMRSSKWDEAETRRRYDNYIHPGPALAGMTCDELGQGQDGVGQHNQSLLPFDFKRLRSVLPPAKERYTVTLRETSHNRHKNSNKEVWCTFAKRIGARVIRDFARTPISLYERVALYAGAQMNYGVPNGPTTLCTYTDYPMTIVADPKTSVKSYSGHGIREGQEFGYFRPGQHIIWGEPTLDLLLQTHERVTWQSERKLFTAEKGLRA